MPRRRFLLTFLLVTGAAAIAEAGQDQSPAKDLYGDPLPPGAIARLGTVRFRHDSAIVFAAFLPGAKSVISVGNNGIACVWEFPSGKEVRRFEVQSTKERPAGAAGRVTSASLSPDGKHLTAFCSDGFLRIWDWANAKEVGKVANAVGAADPSDLAGMLGGGGFGGGFGFPGKGVKGGAASGVRSAVYSPDGKSLMLVGSSRVLQFVEFPTGKEVGPSLGHVVALTSISFTSDGRHLLTQDTRSTHKWDAATGKGLSSTALQLPANPGTPTVISPDGRVGVTVARFQSPAAARAAAVREAVLFDTASGKQVGTIALEVEVAPIHRKPILFSPDSKLLAVNTGSDNEKIALYEVPSGKLLRTLDPGPVAAPDKGMGRPFGVSPQKLLFSPDGKALAFQPGPGAAIVLLDTATGNKIGSLTLAEGSTPARQGAFSPDGRCLALEMGEGMVILYELATGQPRRTYGSKLPPTGKGDPADDPAARLAELLGAGLPSSARSGASFALSLDGKFLALCRPDGTVPLLDVLTGKELAVFKGHTGAVNALAFAPHSKTLASASADTTALLWDVTKMDRPAAAKAPQADNLEAWWQALAGNDAAKAFAAMGDFVAAPKPAVAFLKEQIKPAAPLDSKRVNDLIGQLDATQFKVREKAAHELLKIGDQIVPVVDKALAANPLLETKRRLEELRGQLTGLVLQGERLRGNRAVEVLERIGTPQARQVLQALAEGAPAALVTTSAQASLRRLGR